MWSSSLPIVISDLPISAQPEIAFLYPLNILERRHLDGQSASILLAIPPLFERIRLLLRRRHVDRAGAALAHAALKSLRVARRQVRYLVQPLQQLAF